MQIFEGILFFRAMNDIKTNNVAAASWVLPLGLAATKLLYVFVLFVALKKRIPSKIYLFEIEKKINLLSVFDQIFINSHLFLLLFLRPEVTLCG